jgi:hypothetical protein
MWAPFHFGIPLLPSQELVGHLPIFGIMYLLPVHGAGRAPGSDHAVDAARRSRRATPSRSAYSATARADYLVGC